MGEVTEGRRGLLHPPLQHLDHCLADVREERVAQAGLEKLDGLGHQFSGKIVLHNRVCGAGLCVSCWASVSFLGVHGVRPFSFPPFSCVINLSGLRLLFVVYFPANWYT